jgi:uncharacterized membrane protein
MASLTLRTSSHFWSIGGRVHWVSDAHGIARHSLAERTQWVILKLVTRTSLRCCSTGDRAIDAIAGDAAVKASKRQVIMRHNSKLLTCGLITVCWWCGPKPVAATCERDYDFIVVRNIEGMMAVCHSCGHTLNDSDAVSLQGDNQYWTAETGLLDIVGAYENGTTPFIHDMDNNGMVIGWQGVNGQTLSFRWYPGAGAEALPLPSGHVNAYAQAITNDGRIFGQAGSYGSGHPDCDSEYILWDEGGAHAFTDACEGYYGDVKDANEQDHFIIWHPAIGSHLWDGSAWIDYEYAVHAMNNHDQIIGWYGSEITHAIALLWEDGVPQELQPVTGFNYSRAHSINDDGIIVGTSWKYDPYEYVATYWVDGIAYDMNDLLPEGVDAYLTNGFSINTQRSILASANIDDSSKYVLLKAVRKCVWDCAPLIIGEGTWGDGVVGTEDFFAMLQYWGDCPTQGDCPWDVWPTCEYACCGDGTVGLEDFFALLQHWGPCE